MVSEGNVKLSLARLLVLSLAADFFGCGLSPAQEASTPLQRIVVIARDARLPLGIVLGTDGALCRNDPWSPPKSLGDPLEEIAAITRRYGYTLDRTSPPVLRNLVTTSDHLREGLRYRYSSFPAMAGTMPLLSSNLWGWMVSGYGHARGYGASIGSAPDAEQVALPASAGLSTEEIAGEIVSLGGKGIWIASDRGGSAATGLKLRAESYADDLRDIQFLKCD